MLRPNTILKACRDGGQYIYVLLWGFCICRIPCLQLIWDEERSRSHARSHEHNCFVDVVIRTWPKLPTGSDDLALSIQDLGTLIYFLTLGSRNKIYPKSELLPVRLPSFRSRQISAFLEDPNRRALQGSSVA